MKTLPNKIFNDPVHGFIEVPRGILLELIDSSEFQRLRRIRQLALTSLIYPGALHTRFHHALGAMHLMKEALMVLKGKGIEIQEDEFLGAQIAILLHDIGHGPFSHALENVFLPGWSHEAMSIKLMHQLNRKYEGALSLGIEIFENRYSRPFFHQLVSGQLDMDRMDYLMRDSYFTGVAEGTVGADRIIKTLMVVNDQLVVEQKGIYSVEKFIIARRLMYWQVYLHKAVIAAEYMLINILVRAKELFQQERLNWCNEPLSYFFQPAEHLENADDKDTLTYFLQLDDEDILYAIKQWQKDSDPILSRLCKGLLNRQLLKVRLQNEPVLSAEIEKAKENIPTSDAHYLCFTGSVSNLAYLGDNKEPIGILSREGIIQNLAQASDSYNIEVLSSSVKKFFFCAPDRFWWNKTNN